VAPEHRRRRGEVRKHPLLAEAVEVRASLGLVVVSSLACLLADKVRKHPLLGEAVEV